MSLAPASASARGEIRIEVQRGYACDHAAACSAWLHELLR